MQQSNQITEEFTISVEPPKVVFDIQIEPLETCREEMMQMISDIQWSETELEHATRPADPDWQAYLTGESINKYKQIIIRDRSHNNKIIGYVGVWIFNHLNKKYLLIGSVDFYFILKEYRRTTAGKEMFAFMETFLKEIGVQRVYMPSPVHMHHDKYFASLGYTPQDVIHQKDL